MFLFQIMEVVLLSLFPRMFRVKGRRESASNVEYMVCAKVKHARNILRKELK